MIKRNSKEHSLQSTIGKKKDWRSNTTSVEVTDSQSGLKFENKVIEN